MFLRTVRLSRDGSKADFLQIPTLLSRPCLKMGATLAFLQSPGFPLISTKDGHQGDRAALQGHQLVLSPPWMEPARSHEFVWVEFSEVTPVLILIHCCCLFSSSCLFTNHMGLLVKTEATKALGTSAIPVSAVTKSLIPFGNSPLFLCSKSYVTLERQNQRGIVCSILISKQSGGISQTQC